MTPKKPAHKANWHKVDLHIHTPASIDYQCKNVKYIDILRQASKKNLDCIAFTDHNTISGYKQMKDEIKNLELLESLKRLTKTEKDLLQEFRNLLKQILVLPGFEFTATFGFHILGIFSPKTSIRTIEHILLNLNIPPDDLDNGSSTVGASTDVLTAYKEITSSGGITIAAHSNSNHGVAMRGFRFGGQTKVAFTQDQNLHALEVTDLTSNSKRSTSRFFNGSKPEYPRRMHCIQGSDAHRLLRDKEYPKNLGVGDRTTEILLSDLTFSSLRELLSSSNFSRTRPYRKTYRNIDIIRSAQEEGSSIIQSFHEKMTKRGGHLSSILTDVCAMANTNGGTIFIGLTSEVKSIPLGIYNPSRAIGTIKKEIGKRITPLLDTSIDTSVTRGKTVLRLNVPMGNDRPYAIDDNKIFVRDESETTPAVRDEIVQLIHTNITHKNSKNNENKIHSDNQKNSKPSTITPPRTGVEIVDTELRDGTTYHTMHDLRNGNQVKNVTRASSRRLWHYAIMQKEGQKNIPNNKIKWHGDLGFIKQYRKGSIIRSDLCQRTKDGQTRIYYGVTEDGLHGKWQKISTINKHSE